MFNGFSPETVDFLWGIRLNNNREWFTEHKSDYVIYLYEPMKAFGKAVFAPCADKPGELLKVSRIYRDARLHHPLPYKESLWICIRRAVQWWGENPCLFFEICPEGISYGLSLWSPRVQTMADLRQDWAARPREFIQLIKSTEEAVGIPVSAELYKRPKEAPVPELAPYYAWKTHIRCIREEGFSPRVFDPALAEEVRDTFEKLMPLYDYLNKFNP